MERTLTLRPNFAEARAYYSHFLVIVNRPQDAVLQMELAIELDPYNELIRSLYGMVLAAAGYSDRAIADLQIA